MCSFCTGCGLVSLCVLVCKYCGYVVSAATVSLCDHNPTPTRTHQLLCGAAHNAITFSSDFGYSFILFFWSTFVYLITLICTLHFFALCCSRLSVSIGGHGLGKRFERCLVLVFLFSFSSIFFFLHGEWPTLLSYHRIACPLLH